MTEYYWNVEGDLVKYYRKRPDFPAEYWSVANKRWLPSQDANDTPHALERPHYIKLLPEEAAQRAAEIGAIL